MKDLFVSEVRSLIHEYFSVSVFEGDSICVKILACALAGFAPHSKVAKEGALWWETTSADDIEDGLATLRYWTYEWFNNDGWRWACAHHYAVGLQNFVQQHNIILDEDVAEEYKALQSTIFWGVRGVDSNQTYHYAMRSWYRQARKLGRLRLKWGAEKKIKYRIRHKLYKR